jgi:AAA15 family ATPase/GTPase
MIVEFSVKNFRSIKELQTISFVATKLDSNKDKYPDVDNNNIVEEGDMRLLKTIGIYGANASGKSNVIRALEYFIQAIKNEPSSESNLRSLCDPFLYQDNASESESFFQLTLITNNKKYRYGFTVKRNLDVKENDSKEIITSEWLYGQKEKNMVEFFIRKEMEVNKDNLPNEDLIPTLPYKHSLFLTHAAAFDGAGTCKLIRNYLQSRTISNYSNGLDQFRKNTIWYLQVNNEINKENLLKLLSSFNLKYDNLYLDIEKNENSEPIFVDDLPHDKIFLFKKIKGTPHLTYNVLNLKDNESAGTRKLFDLAGLLIRIFNEVPVSILIILDELDSEFHPALLIKLIELFNDPEINKSKSQLLFTSHDTNLLDPAIMRRDQFYFTEKDENDATRLYSLADLKGIRNDADFAKQYLAGFYGAIPHLEDYINNSTEKNDKGLE